MMKRIFLLFFIIPFFLHGSYNKRVKKRQQASTNTRNKKRTISTKYILYVSGVECKLCAQAVVELLEKIEGVEHVALNMVGLDYTNSYFHFFWTKKNENIPLITLRRNIEKEGFELISIEGKFYGSFERASNTICWNLEPGLRVPLENYSLKLHENKIMALNGKIVQDIEKKEFKASLL
jgi:hypothetical protein